jgi:hypothetical protein
MPLFLTRSVRTLAAVAFAALLAGSAPADEHKGKKIEPNALPKAVADALKAKFPNAVVTECHEEKDGDKVMYDVDFTVGKQKYEAEMLADGTIKEWEKEIDASALPKAVRDAVEKKYPKATIKEAEEVYVPKDGKDVMEGYEVDIVTADKKEIGLMVAADGRILKEEEAKKDEKKGEKK